MSVDFSLKLLYPEKVKKNILIAMNKHLTLKFKTSSSLRDFENKASILLHQKMMSSPTTKAILNGDLREEFGLTNPEEIDSILFQIANNSTFDVRGPKMTRNHISMTISYKAVPPDVSHIPGAGIQQTEKGQTLPWLKWLTELGDSVIVKEYEVRAGFPQSSRTGDKIMVAGQGWRVPPQHAGSSGNNFITKASEEALDEIGKLFVKVIRTSL